MAWLSTLLVVVGVQVAAATPEAPQITAIAKLVQARQEADPSALGWVSTSGASEFSDLRRCDFPASLTRRGSYAQCCEANHPCEFYTSCSANTLFASAATVPCDNGFCNTGVIVPTLGAESGASYLGCWATELGTAAFTLVQDIGSAPTAAATPIPSGSDSASSSRSGASSDKSVSSSATTTDPSTTTNGGESTPTSSNAAIALSQPLSGVVGLVAGFLALL